MEDELRASRKESWRDVGGQRDGTWGLILEEVGAEGELEEEEDEEGEERPSDSSASMSESSSVTGRS